MRRLLALALVALVGILALRCFRWERNPSQGLLVDRTVPLPQLAPVSLLELRTPSVSGQDQSIHAELADPSLDRQATRTIRGTVLGESTGLPCVGYQVAVARPLGSWFDRDLNASLEPWLRQATTDQRGSFEVPWPAESDGRLLDVQVTSADGAVLFDGMIRLQPEVVLHVPDPVLFEGRLLAEPFLECESITLTVYALEQSAPRRCGESRLSRRGEFSLSMIPAPGCSRYALHFVHDGLGGGISVPITADELLGGRELELRRSIAILGVRCHGPDGVVKGVRVRASALGYVAALPGSEQVTGEDGTSRFFLESGPHEVCAGGDGFEPILELLDVLPGVTQHLVQLAPVRRTFSGIVLDSSGKPLMGAFVSVRPIGTTESARLAGITGVRTDGGGRFTLPRYSARSELTAYHARYGLTAPMLLSGGEAFVRVLFEPVGILRIELTCSHEQASFFSGLAEYMLVDRFVERNLFDSAAPPLVIQNVPAGQYNAYVRLGALFGEASVDVAPDAETRVALELQQGTWMSGHVLARDHGVGDLSIRLVEESWPVELVRIWGTATVQSDGSFRLFTGSRAAAEVEVLRRGEPVKTATLEAGNDELIELPLQSEGG
jgi:hypothetical protein